LIIVAKDNITHTRLAKQFQRKEIFKQYIAIVEGDVEFEENIIDEPIGQHPKFREKKTVAYDDAAKDSVTRYRVIKRGKGVTLIALYPRTGRTHQLRVHMAFIKHPILGDDKYGKKGNYPRLALHAQTIGFKHPHTKEYVEFVSCPPRDFLQKVSPK
jgi:23S rRNA pseudouridine1911/1915/1917 synthase